MIIRRRFEDAHGRSQPATSSSKKFSVSCNNLNPAANGTTAFRVEPPPGVHRFSARTFHMAGLGHWRTFCDARAMPARERNEGEIKSPMAFAVLRLMSSSNLVGCCTGRSITAKQSNQVAASHSITSSARARRVGGISRPSTLAVFRLISSVNFVGCSIGSIGGLAPLRILST